MLCPARPNITYPHLSAERSPYPFSFRKASALHRWTLLRSFHIYAARFLREPQSYIVPDMTLQQLITKNSIEHERSKSQLEGLRVSVLSDLPINAQARCTFKVQRTYTLWLNSQGRDVGRCFCIQSSSSMTEISSCDTYEVNGLFVSQPFVPTRACHPSSKQAREIRNAVLQLHDEAKARVRESCTEGRMLDGVQ